MKRPCMLLAFSAVVVITASCATQQQMLNQNKGAAVQAALQRAQFEMNCPTATGTVLSQDMIQPAIQGPWVSGMQRTEYTIGVEGCGQREVFVVMCQVGTTTCFAANPRQNYILQR